MKFNNKILRGLYKLLKKDAYLLSVDINERSITHKLAEYYQGLFPGWNVDCEYNKNLLVTKQIVIDPKDFLAKMADFIESHYGDDSLIFFSQEGFNKKRLSELVSDLRNRENVLYDDELDLVCFVLQENDGRKIVKTIFPDIIIHHRGTKNNNIVIEAKKSTNKNEKARMYDIVKLLTLVASPEYHYKQGIFIDIPTGQDFSSDRRFNVSQPFFDNKVFKIE